ncbi:hypothetical protein [Actinosynnema sp. NPDC020468]|uniref:hypothetical protein n=1 Tax=Actinosynnema sp. NPDC020468 TaxID=3154488 RepID=UPI0033C3C4B6
MGRPELRIELPPDLPNDRYAGIADAVSSLLELWGVDGAAEVVDESKREEARRAAGRS